MSAICLNHRPGRPAGSMSSPRQATGHEYPNGYPRVYPFVWISMDEDRESKEREVTTAAAR